MYKYYSTVLPFLEQVYATVKGMHPLFRGCLDLRALNQEVLLFYYILNEYIICIYISVISLQKQICTILTV